MSTIMANQLELEAQANNDGLELHHQSTVTPRDGSSNGQAIPISNNQAIKPMIFSSLQILSPIFPQLPQQGNVLFNWNNPELAVNQR